MAPPSTNTFHEIASRGSEIAAAPFERSDFENIVRDINQRFGLSIIASDNVFELLQDRLRFVAGRFWLENDAVDRKSVLDRIGLLRGSIRHMADQLAPVRGGLHEEADFQTVQFLVGTIQFSRGCELTEARARVENMLTFLDNFGTYIQV